MEHVYAALILHETGAEINESNLTAVLDSAGATVTTSRIKAVVAALEDVDLAATKAKTMSAGEAELAVTGPDDGALEPGETADSADESGSLDALFEGKADESTGEDGTADEDDEISRDSDDTESADDTGA